MKHGKHWIWLALLVTALGLTCAPRGDDPPSGIKTDKPPVKELFGKNDLKPALEAALTDVKGRTLKPDHGFWTIFHAILGMGFDTELVVGKKGERVRAIDFVADDAKDADGKEMPGRTFTTTKNGADVL